MADNVEKSGVHLTGADSGWPVGNTAAEPPHTKDGTGADPFPAAASVAGGVVKDAGKDEVQKVTFANVEGGTFTLAVGAKTTPAIEWGEAGPTAAALQAAITALSTVGAGNCTVAGEPGGPYTFTFGGDLVDTNVAQIVVDGGELEGEEAEASVETTQAGSPL